MLGLLTPAPASHTCSGVTAAAGSVASAAALVEVAEEVEEVEDLLRREEEDCLRLTTTW